MISCFSEEDTEKLCHCLKALEKILLETNQVINWVDGEVITFMGVRKIRQNFTTENILDPTNRTGETK